MAFVLVCLSACLQVISADLEKVAAAFPAIIRSKKELQDHILASLTHIIAHFRRSAVILSGILTVFCARLNWRGYESICDLGEDMRRKRRYWLINSSSKYWRSYESAVANLWSF